MTQHVAIAGAGAFGTALALIAHKAGREVTLWGRNPQEMEAIRSRGENVAYLRGVDIPAAIRLTAEPGRCARPTSCSSPCRPRRRATVAMLLAADGLAGKPVVACAKGIEAETGRLQSEIIAEVLPGARPAALSGPGFAEEIARDQPTAVTIAAADLALAHALCTRARRRFLPPLCQRRPRRRGAWRRGQERARHRRRHRGRPRRLAKARAPR